jgi:hypothetical protein
MRRRDIEAIRQRHWEEDPYHAEHFGKFGWNAHIDRGQLIAALNDRDAEIALLRAGLNELAEAVRRVTAALDEARRLLDGAA